MCGIFGVFNAPQASEFTAFGLHWLQHRALDYAGMVTSDGVHFYRHSGPGLSRQVFTQGALDQLHGRHALGHIRYPTVDDDPRRDNTQPIIAHPSCGSMAFAHNGNLTNTQELRANGLSGTQFATSMDTECIAQLCVAAQSEDPIASLQNAFTQIRGSYALGILMHDCLIAVRDPSGNRPLSLGQNGDSYFISSETLSLDRVEAKFVRDIEAGEILVISAAGLSSHRIDIPADTRRAQCRFEAAYYTLPGSRVFDEEVADFRIRMGMKLEELFPVPRADIIVPVPDSSNFIALGFSRSGRSGDYMMALLRSHSVGRTFIAVTQVLRDAEVKAKFSVVPNQIAGKVVVLVDDSIVRLTTLPPIVRMLQQAGAKGVHVRIGLPPITHPCEYGINTPTSEELAASHSTVDEIRQRVGADSLEFMTTAGLHSLSANPDDFCYACMTGDYPLPR